MNDLDDLKKEVARFIAEREWDQFHTPKNLSMSVAIEAAELMELFQWGSADGTSPDVTEPRMRERIEEEVADTLIYLLSFSNRLGIDLGAAVLSKLEKNRVKYPVDRCRGHYTNRP